MNKKWLILGSVSFSVGLSLGLIVDRDIKQAALTGLLSVPAAAGVSVVEHQRRQKLNDKISTQEKQLQGLVQQKAEFSNSITLLSDRLANLKQQEEDIKIVISNLDLNKQQSQYQVYELGDRKSSLEPEIKTLEVKLRQFKEQETASTKLLADLFNCQQQVETKIEIDRHTSEDLQKQKSNLEGELNDLERQKQRLNDELDSQQHSLDRLQQNKADLENAIANLATKKQKLDVQFRQQQQLRTEIESLQQDKFLAEMSLAKLESQTEQIAADCVELEAKNNLIQSELDNRIVQKNDLDTEVDRLKNEKLELSRSLTRLEQDKSNIQSQLNTFQTGLNNLREQKENLAIQVQQLKSLLEISPEEIIGDKEELDTEDIDLAEIIDIRENINDHDLKLSSAKNTKYLWQNVILPNWNHRDRSAGYRFLGNVELDYEQSDRITNLVRDELQKRRGIFNNLEENLLKLITFVLSEYAYYSEEERFWEGFCDHIRIEHNQTVENTLREVTEQGINLLGLIRATGGYKYVSTLWLQSGVPKQKMRHFADIVQDVANEYGWWELSHSSALDIAEALWQCWESRYSQCGTIRHFLSLENSNEDLEPISGQLVKNIAIVARELEYKKLDPETINDKETREELIGNTNLSYSFFLRDWSDLITVLTPRNNDRFCRIARRRNRSPYLYLDIADTLNTLLIIPEQSLWKKEWQILRGTYCLIPETGLEVDIPREGNLEIPELKIDITQAEDKWTCQLQNHHRNQIYKWEHEGINSEFPCLIFDAISGENIQIDIFEPKIIGIEEIRLFTPKKLKIEFDNDIEVIDNLVASSIKNWHGKEIRLVESEALI